MGVERDANAPTTAYTPLNEKLEQSTGAYQAMNSKVLSQQVGHATSLAGKLRQREIHGMHPGQRAWIGNPLIPTEPTAVAIHTQQNFCGIFSPDGSEFISAGQDRSVRVYDPITWKVKFAYRPREFGWSILDLDCGRDGTIISSTWSSNVCYHGRGNNQVLISMSEEDCGLFSVRISPNGNTIIGGGSDETVHFVDIATGEGIHIPAHADHINAVNWVGDSGHLALSGSDDGLIKLWDTRALGGPAAASFVGHLDGISFLDSTKCGTYFLSNSKDQSIKLWDLRKSTDPRIAVRPPETNWDYRYGEEAMGETARLLRNGTYGHKNDHSIRTYRGHAVFRTLIRARFSPVATTGERYIYAGSGGAPSFAVHVYDVSSGDVVERLPGHRGLVRDVSWNPNFPQIVSTSWDCSHVAWNLKPTTFE